MSSFSDAVLSVVVGIVFTGAALFLAMVLLFIVVLIWAADSRAARGRRFRG